MPSDFAQTHRHDKAKSLFATLQTHQKMTTGRNSKVCAEMMGVHSFHSQQSVTEQLTIGNHCSVPYSVITSVVHV